MLAIGVIACGDDDDDATGAATTGAATTAAASSSPAVTSTGAAASNTDDARQLAEPVLFKADAAEWDRLVAAAKNEGTVVVSGPGIPALREGIVNGFKEAFGISVDFVTLPPGQLQPRIQQELKTGKVSIDVTMGGSCFLNNQAGILDNTRDLIVDPSLFKDGVWSGGQLRPGFPEPGVPADYYCGLQTALYVMPDLWVNPEKVNPAEITSWKDLLDPKYKGKIATFDPALGGPAGTTIGYLGRLFGNDFVVNLFKGQDAVYSTDLRQQAEWLVRGTYPIVVGLPHQFVEPLLAQGLPGERIFPGDGPGSLTGGYGTVSIIKDAPHSAAAAVFMNWFASQPAQEMYEEAALELSLRNDVSHNVPDYIKPKDGETYPVDDYSPGHFFKYRVPAQDALKNAAE